MKTLYVITALLCAGCLGEPHLGDPKVERVCVNNAHLGFTGSGDESTRSRLDLGQLNLDSQIALTNRITMSSAMLSAGDGITGFGFVEHIRVELSAANQPAVPLSELRVSSDEVSVDLRGDPRVDLSKYLLADPQVAVAITGDLPTQRWSALLDLCFDVEPL